MKLGDKALLELGTDDFIVSPSKTTYHVVLTTNAENFILSPDQAETLAHYLKEAAEAVRMQRYK